jgi:hypothetical protein
MCARHPILFVTYTRKLNPFPSYRMCCCGGSSEYRLLTTGRARLNYCGQALSSKCLMELFTVVVAETTLVSSSHVWNYALAFETTKFVFYRLVKFDCFTHCLTMCQGLKYTFGDSGGKRVSFQEFQKKTMDIYLHISVSVCLSIYPSVRKFVSPSVYLHTSLPTGLPVMGAHISCVEATLATFALE